LLIDLASQYGHSKLLYRDRLSFGRELLPLITDTPINKLKDVMGDYIKKAKDPEMFCTALIAIHDAINGIPSGFMIGLDASSSGPQLLSLLTRCLTGMRNTGAINTGEVPQLYKIIQGHMGDFPIDQVKKATIPHMYGSSVAPKNVFGEDVPKFIAACLKTVPGAEWAKNILIGAWDPTTTYHEWELPDGGIAHVKCITTKDYKGKFNGYTYTYRTQIISAIQEGKGTKSLAANVTHSYDGFIVRELQRRCNYNPAQVKMALSMLDHPAEPTHHQLALQKCEKRANKYQFVSVVALEHICPTGVANASYAYLDKLRALFTSMLEYPPHEVRCIH